jgi:hypothetical protein
MRKSLNEKSYSINSNSQHQYFATKSTALSAFGPARGEL